VLSLAWQNLQTRFGRPGYILDENRQYAEFAIVAYGKLGGIELGYSSDVDVVFLHDSTGSEQQTSGPREIDNPSFFAKMAQRIIHMLTLHTGAGVLYEVDTRLRPSGRSGLLVSSFDAFAEYQKNQAWTWEHQALVRARVVAGPNHLVQRFSELRQRILCQSRDIDALRQEVCEMRERMYQTLQGLEEGMFHVKHSRGGITDIEFLVQFCVLAYAQREVALVEYTDNIRQLDALQKYSVLSIQEATLLRDAYRAMRHRIHLLALQETKAIVPQDEFADLSAGVLEIWKKYMDT
jgi:glutamate-ammonia-ligase adenylyltransferase